MLYIQSKLPLFGYTSLIYVVYSVSIQVIRTVLQIEPDGYSEVGAG